MAFLEADFDPGASPKGSPNRAAYFTTDAAATVEAAGYFNSIIASLLQGKTVARGTILCDMSDELTQYGFTATESTGVVLLDVTAANQQIWIP